MTTKFTLYFNFQVTCDFLGYNWSEITLQQSIQSNAKQKVVGGESSFRTSIPSLRMHKAIVNLRIKLTKIHIQLIY